MQRLLSLTKKLPPRKWNFFAKISKQNNMLTFNCILSKPTSWYRIWSSVWKRRRMRVERFFKIDEVGGRYDAEGA